MNTDNCNRLVSAAIGHLVVKMRKYKPNGPASFYTWAYKVMKNAMIDELRKWQREQRSSAELDHKMKIETVTGIQSSTKNFEKLLSDGQHLLTRTELRIVEVYIEKNGMIPDTLVAEMIGLQSAASVRVHRCHILRKFKALIKQRS